MISLVVTFLPLVANVVLFFIKFMLFFFVSIQSVFVVFIINFNLNFTYGFKAFKTETVLGYYSSE